MHKKCAMLSWASMRFSFSQEFHKNQRPVTSSQRRVSYCCCCCSTTKLPLQLDWDWAPIYTRGTWEANPAHLLSISGKTRGCGRTLWKQRRNAVLETRKNQIGSHVTSSLVISKPCRVSFKRCKWIPNQSLKVWRHTVHTAESHSQTNCSCITWLSGFS